MSLERRARFAWSQRRDAYSPRPSLFSPNGQLARTPLAELQPVVLSVLFPNDSTSMNTVFNKEFPTLPRIFEALEEEVCSVASVSEQYLAAWSGLSWNDAFQLLKRRRPAEFLPLA